MLRLAILIVLSVAAPVLGFQSALPTLRTPSSSGCFTRCLSPRLPGASSTPRLSEGEELAYAPGALATARTRSLFSRRDATVSWAHLNTEGEVLAGNHTSHQGQQTIRLLGDHVEKIRCPRLPLKFLERKALPLLGEFTGQELCTVMSMYGMIGTSPGRAMIEGLEAHWVAKMEEMGDARGVADTLYAYGKLRLEPGEAMMRALQAKAIAEIGSFTPHALAKAWWACAKLADVCGGAEPLDPLLRALGDATLVEVQNFEPRDMSDTLWAHAKLNRLPEGALLDRFTKRTLDTVDEFEPKDISNTLWALATLGVIPTEDVVKAFGDRAVSLMQGFRPGNVADTIWALAQLAVPPQRDLLHELESRAAATMSKFSPKNIARIMWAFGKLDTKPTKELLATVQARVVATIESFKPANVADTMWAFARLEVMPRPDLLDAISARAEDTWLDFAPEERKELTEAVQDLRRLKESRDQSAHEQET